MRHDIISKDSQIWLVGVVARMGEQNITEALACCRSLLGSLESDLKGQKKTDNGDNFDLKTEYLEKKSQKNGKSGKKYSKKQKNTKEGL